MEFQTVASASGREEDESAGKRETNHNITISI